MSSGGIILLLLIAAAVCTLYYFFVHKKDNDNKVDIEIDANGGVVETFTPYPNRKNIVEYFVNNTNELQGIPGGVSSDTHPGGDDIVQFMYYTDKSTRPSIWDTGGNGATYDAFIACDSDSNCFKFDVNNEEMMSKMIDDIVKEFQVLFLNYYEYLKSIDLHETDKFKAKIFEHKPSDVKHDDYLPKQFLHEVIFKGYIDYINGDSSQLTETLFDNKNAYMAVIDSQVAGLSEFFGFIIQIGVGAIYIDNDKKRLMSASDTSKPAIEIKLGHDIPILFGIGWIALILSLKGKKLGKVKYTKPSNPLSWNDITNNMNITIKNQQAGEGNGIIPLPE